MHGLIFLFKWSSDVKQDGKVVLGESADSIYFAKQVFLFPCMYVFVSPFMIKLMFRLCSVDKNMVLEEKGKKRKMYNKEIDWIIK